VSTSAVAAAAAAAVAADVDRDTKDARSSSFRFDLSAVTVAHSARSAYRARSAMTTRRDARSDFPRDDQDGASLL